MGSYDSPELIYSRLQRQIATRNRIELVAWAIPGVAADDFRGDQGGAQPPFRRHAISAANEPVGNAWAAGRLASGHEGSTEGSVSCFAESARRSVGLNSLDAALLALDESPVPAAELTKLNSILGHELLSEILQISAASLQRYQNGDREAPDAVADRAHFLTSVIAALEGTYNEFGVRRWFERPRSVFDGRSARQLLSRAWKSSDESARRILDCADSLQHLGAT
jgi:hypothetical protein